MYEKENWGRDRGFVEAVNPRRAKMGETKQKDFNFDRPESER